MIRVKFRFVRQVAWCDDELKCFRIEFWLCFLSRPSLNVGRRYTFDTRNYRPFTVTTIRNLFWALLHGYRAKIDRIFLQGCMKSAARQKSSTYPLCGWELDRNIFFASAQMVAAGFYKILLDSSTLLELCREPILKVVRWILHCEFK